MPRFHIHVINETGEAYDEDGLELPNAEAARSEAVQGIRSILSHEVLEGLLNLRGRAEIFDAEGHLIYVIPFEHAVEVRSTGEDDDRAPSRPAEGS
jgi:hypothetical protein